MWLLTVGYKYAYDQGTEYNTQGDHFGIEDWNGCGTTKCFMFA